MGLLDKLKDKMSGKSEIDREIDEALGTDTYSSKVLEGNKQFDTFSETGAPARRDLEMTHAQSPLEHREPPAFHEPAGQHFGEPARDTSATHFREEPTAGFSGTARYNEPLQRPQSSGPGLPMQESVPEEPLDMRRLESLSFEIKTIKSQNELILEKLRVIEDRLRRFV